MELEAKFIHGRNNLYIGMKRKALEIFEPNFLKSKQQILPLQQQSVSHFGYLYGRRPAYVQVGSNYLLFLASCLSSGTTKLKFGARDDLGIQSLNEILQLTTTSGQVAFSNFSQDILPYSQYFQPIRYREKRCECD